MSGKFIVPIQLPLLYNKPDHNPQEGYYKLYLRNGKLRKLDWYGTEEEIGGTDITQTQIANWNEAYSWGDHADAGYVTLSTVQSITASKTFEAGIAVRTSFTVNPLGGTDNNFIEAGSDRWFRIHHATTDWTNSHLFRGVEGFNRVDHYGAYNGVYNTGHQYNFYDSGDLSTTAGLWNISFFKGNGVIATRPLITINNGQGAGIFNTPLLKMFANGNMTLGISTDTGYKFSVNGTIRATSFLVTSGTASQFLKANGTVDSTSYTPASRTLTINGTAYDLTADRSWTISTATPTLAAVTTAGNTTTNPITVGAITGNIGSISQFKFNAGAGSATPNIAVGNLDTSGKFAALLAGTVGAEFNFDNSGWFAIAGDSKSNYNSNNLGSGSETYYLRIQGSTGNIQINSTLDAGYKLDVNGTIRVNNEVRFTGIENVETTSMVYYDTTTGKLTYGAKPVTQLEKRSDYVESTSYCGTAPLGSAESATVWKIKKIVIASDGSTTTTTATNVAWTNRLTAIYI
jgi:hypothetical protein